MNEPAMTDLATLITRLERATGPDRELGNEVLFQCGWTQAEGGNNLCDPYLEWTAPDGDSVLDGDQPDPTASLDAALTLAKGTGFAIAGPWVYADHHEWAGREIYNAALADEVCGVDVENLEDFPHSGSGATPAIALCIAALRARTGKE